MAAIIMNVRDGEFWPGTETHPLGSLFSSPPWVEALTRTYGFDISASASTRRGVVKDAILFSRVSDLRGDRIVCLPFSDYCDPFVEDGEIWEELIEPILGFRMPVSLRCLRNEVAVTDRRFTRVGQALWHCVDLTRPEDDLWAGLSGSARQNIRKAGRNGVTVREGDSLEDVRLFHRMHRHLRKEKYRLLAQPVAFFDNLHALFSPSRRLTVLLAEKDGVPLAGIFFIEWNGTLYYKFNASLDPALCPNDLLAWEGIRLGRRRGLARLDFGLSDIAQPGLVRYKRKYATEERTISLLRWEPPGYSDPRSKQASETLRRVTELLTDPAVPEEITGAAGDDFYRFFC